MTSFAYITFNMFTHLLSLTVCNQSPNHGGHLLGCGLLFPPLPAETSALALSEMLAMYAQSLSQLVKYTSCAGRILGPAKYTDPNPWIQLHC